MNLVVFIKQYETKSTIFLCVATMRKKEGRNQPSCEGLERSSSIVIKDKPIGYKNKEGRRGIDHNCHEKEIEKLLLHLV